MPVSSDTLLRVLWQMSWQAGVIALVVLLIQQTLGRFISHRWRHALWTLVLLRLLMPALPHSRFGLLPMHSPFAGADQHANPMPTPAAPAFQIVKWEILPSDPALVPAAHPPIVGQSTPHWQQSTAWMIVWLSSALLLLMLRICTNLRFQRRLNRSLEPTPQRLIPLLHRACGQFRIRQMPALCVTKLVDATAVTGIFRARILLPAASIDSLSDEQLHLILLHELAHIACFDVALDWLWAVLVSVHWFNPILWAIGPIRRNDRELARDEMVLSRCGQPRAYGQLLLDLSQPVRLPTFCPGLIGMMTRKNRLTRRVKMVARFNGNRWYSAWIGLILLAIGGGCMLTARPVSPPTTDSAVAENASATKPVSEGVKPQSPDGDLVTRRYDVNDLLFVPTDYGNTPNLGLSNQSQGSNNNQSQASNPSGDIRVQRMHDLVKYIVDNVEPASWKDNGGKVGSISSSPLRALLLITHTVEAQRKIQTVLDALRESRSIQISIETRIISLPEDSEDQLPQSLQNHLSAVRYAGRLRRDQFLTQAEVNQLLQCNYKNNATHQLTAPRLTLFSGQTGELVVQTQQAYVADFNKIPASATQPVHFEPVPKTTTATGVTLKLTSCPSGDSATIFVDLHARVIRLLKLMPEQFGSDPAAGAIQRPVSEILMVDNAYAIPDRSTLLLGCARAIDAGDANFNADSPDKVRDDAEVETLRQDSHMHQYLLIKPTLLRSK